MDALHLEYASPKAFILATDGSFTPFCPGNDQVWELGLSDHAVHPINLHTTYGLRARAMRLFPSLSIENKRLATLGEYDQPPAVTRYLPDAFQVTFAPIRGLDVQFEGYLPSCDTLVGAITVANNSTNPLNIFLELAAVLAPMPKGTPTHPDKDGINQIITGQSGALCPVLFMTGGPTAVSSPYPALTVPMLLAPGQTRKLTWALATQDSRLASLAAARRISATDWTAAVREHAMAHARRTLQVRTGEPNWDSAFFLSQIQAQTHHIRVKDGSLFLRSRLPDEADQKQNKPWDDLTLLEAQHLFQILLPTDYPALAAQLESFLERILANAVLPSRLYAVSPNKPVRECPLLAQLYLALYEVTEDAALLEKAYPRLCQLFEGWFRREDPSDFDQMPIWDDPRQCQLGTGSFHFDSWEETGHGMDIRWVQSPALLAMLHQEAAALARIAKILKDRPTHKKFNELEKALRERIQSTWNEDQTCFSYQDIESQNSPTRELYFPGRVQPKLEVHKAFLQPQRLQLHLTSSDENTRSCRIQISGEDSSGALIEEVIKSYEIRWVMGKAHLTTRHLFQSLHALTIEGLKTGDRFLLETADLSQPDITCLLPLWSGAVTEEQCEALLAAQLDPEAESQTRGIPETWRGEHELPRELTVQTSVLWNTLLIEGLLKAGQQEAAAQHFTHLMTAIVNGLRNYAGFFPFYATQTGQPAGSRNALAGLAPVELFLALAGIRIFSPRKVALWGHNPFPWPVEVHWQGLSIRREAIETFVTFPDGSHYQGETEKPLMLSMQLD